MLSFVGKHDGKKQTDYDVADEGFMKTGLACAYVSVSYLFILSIHPVCNIPDCRVKLMKLL